MKNYLQYILLTLLVFVSFSLTSCEVIGDIFRSGMWVGIIIVVVVVALILWIIRKMS